MSNLVEASELFSAGIPRTTEHECLLHALSIFEPADGVDVVYFIECGDLIKIGTSNQMRVRLRQTTNGSAAPVTLLATHPGTRIAERATHDKFDHLRQHGEWFSDAPELREHIEGVLDGRWDLRAETVL